MKLSGLHCPNIIVYKHKWHRQHTVFRHNLTNFRNISYIGIFQNNNITRILSL